MSFNFPNSPTVGQSYTPASGPTFIWDGTAWKGATQGMPVTVFVSDSAPTNPAVGQMWWESDTGNLFIWYADADSSQWVQVSGSVSAVQTALTQNKIVNPAMQHSQENGNTAGSINAYSVADQWEVHLATSGAVNFNRTPAVTPYGSTNRLYAAVITADTSLSAGEYFAFRQKIEGARIADFQWGTPNAKQVVVRFGFIGPVGTYSFGILNAAANRSYVAPFTVSTVADNYYTFVVPGDTTGTWPKDNTLGMYFCVNLAASASLQTAPGVWTAGALLGHTGMSNVLGVTSAAAGVYINLYDVGLYLDPLNTGIPPRWQMPDEAGELLACQRYYQRIADRFYEYGATAAANIVYCHRRPVRLRVAGSVSFADQSYTNTSAVLTTNPDTADSVGMYSTATATGAVASAFTVISNARM